MKDEKSAIAELAKHENLPNDPRRPILLGKPQKAYDHHPIADAFPMCSDAELHQLRASIGSHGQRVRGVLLDGKLLEGRNRQKACHMVGVEFLVREFGSEESDGTSPAQFVADMNLHRRQMTSGQKAMAALALIPFFEAESKAKDGDTKPAETVVDTGGDYAQTPPRKSGGKSAAKAARAAGTSRSQVERAKKLAAADPKAAKDVAAGKTSLNKAITAAELESAYTRIEENCGKKLADAVRAGIRIRRKAEVIQFAKLPKDKMQDIQGLIETADWKVKDALLFKAKDLSPAHRIADLHARAAKEGGKHVCEIDGYRHTVERVAKLEIPKPAPKPAAKKAPSKPAKKTAPKKPKKAKK